MTGSRSALASALALGALLAFAAATPAAGRAGDPNGAGLRLPARISLTISNDPSRELDLFWMGSCCAVKSLDSEPPETFGTVPPPKGTGRVFHVLEIARSRILLSIEDLDEPPSSGSPILVRADLNQNDDLADDPPIRCFRDHSCGPLRFEARYDGGTAPYAVTLRYFDLSGHSYLWYWRASALVGTVAGRRIAIVDDNSNGMYDDDDLVAFDADGDGRLDGSPEGRESWRLPSAIPWGDTFFQVAGVDPVANVLTLDRARTVDTVHHVVDEQSGSPVGGARITYQPGSVSAVTDARGETVVSKLGGRPDLVSVVASGYWDKVYGPNQQAGEVTETIRLAPGPCPADGVRWCGRESLRASSMTNSSLDLDSGVVGPRPGDAPGAWDLGWYAPRGGMELAAKQSARLAVLDADFDTLTREDLRDVSFDDTPLLASEACNEASIKGPTSPEGGLRRGTVLAVRTREGRLGKVRIERCGFDLELSWVLYEETEDGSGDAGSVPTRPPRR